MGTPGLLPSLTFWLLIGAAAVDTDLAWPICFANATCADGSAGQRCLIDIDVEGPQGGAASTVFLRRPHFDPVVRFSFPVVLLDALMEDESLSIDISVCAIQGIPTSCRRARRR
jgi:hypothetical protein